jgi:type VI secretion system protein ImpK
MPTSYDQVAERRPNLALAFEELLTAIVRLRSNRQAVSDAESFKTHVRTALHSAMQEGAARGYAPADVEIAAYAVVAFLDESILNLRNPVFATWSGQSLQQELSQKHLAGEAFFEYLQQLMGRRDSVELADLLDVFYLCLLLGYRGRYGSASMGELSAIMRSIQNKISRSRGVIAVLSPQAVLPRDLPQPKAPDKWSKRLTWAAALTAAVSLFAFALFKIVLINSLSELKSLAGH